MIPTFVQLRSRSARRPCATASGCCWGIRRENLENRLNVQKQRVEPRQREISETKSNVTRLSESLKLAERELAIIAPMASRNMVAQTELLRAQRQLVEVRGRLATSRETLARVESALEEARRGGRADPPAPARGRRRCPPDARSCRCCRRRCAGRPSACAAPIFALPSMGSSIRFPSPPSAPSSTRATGS